ncbi:MAG: LysR family transcriptional regulator [Oscillospiraceae bacterium]
MTIEQLKCFFEVAHCHSFSKAAERLFLSQANLSKYIKSLEEEMGATLFDRGSRPCRLTEAGSLFYRQTKDLFFKLNSQIEETKLRNRNKYHLIYIGISPGEPSPPPFTNLLSTLNKSSAPYRYILLENNYAELINKLASREVDCIITTDRNARSIPDFECLKLAPFQMMLAVHKDNPKAQKPDLKPKDCTDDIVFLSIPDGKNAPISRIQEFDLHTGCGLNPIILPSPSDLLNNVAISAGVAIVPQTVNPSSYPDIRFIPFEPERRDAGQFLLWRRDTNNAAVLRLVELARTLPPSDGGASSDTPDNFKE